jgi:hypothetical protein
MVSIILDLWLVIQMVLTLQPLVILMILNMSQKVVTGNNDGGKELVGIYAALAEFNETYMEGRMGLDLDDIVVQQLILLGKIMQTILVVKLN